MPERWLGYLRGSRTGTLFVEVPDEGAPILTIGFTGAGDLRMRVLSTGDNTCDLTLETGEELFGTAIMESRTDTHVEGSWKFISGASGLFELTRHEGQQQLAENLQTITPRVWSREVQLGAVTLYRPDVQRLIAELRSLIERPCNIAARAVEGSNIIAQDIDAYLARADYVDIVRVLTLSAEEITKQPLKRIATIRLEQDSTVIFVSSTEEIWTTAAAMQLADYVRQFMSRTTGWLRRYGLNINGFILIAILLWMPDRPLIERIVVFLLGVLLMTGITRSHRLIPYNRVYLDPDKEKRPFAKELPAVVMATLAGLVTTFLSSVPKIAEVLVKLYEVVIHRLGS